MTNDVIVCNPRPLRFWQRLYLVEILKGLGVTLRHFLGNLFARKYTVTVEWPEVKREYSERMRGRHVLLTREDGSPRCVACYMCETACPADCIHIEAEEDPEAPVEWEKKPKVFTIDLLRCVFCGFCVDACPKEAIIMTREHEMAFRTREEAVIGLDQLLYRGPLDQLDMGYRPYYGEPRTQIRLPIPRQPSS
ncbi:MAG: NADH-quinone oxidoreductase subunit I [Thermoanaerobaculum sp.]|nr:NADH-quinone oxidoreductase subunit I [Thermoanaerobaculum sp.]MDW7967236.1 NADH-quinone oxidoreductase subunit I [Thermoanaerobaculum sp.]